MSMAKNLMQGDQHAIPFVLKMKDGTLITDAMVKTVVLNLGNLSRQYPGDVTYKNGQWLFPVTQAQTFAMRGSVEPQARVEFLNDDIFGGAGEPVELQNALNKGIIGTDGTTAAKQNAPTMQTELQGAILVIVAAAGVEFSAEGAVRYDETQQLTDEQKAQAQQNIGVKAVTPDYQENDPESPNYIRNRNGGYYEQGEQFLNAVYPFNNFQIPVAYKNDNPVVCVNVNDTDGTKTFWKAFSYFCEKGNLETVGFYLRYTGAVANGNEQYSYILEYKDGTKSVRMYDATPVIWPSDFIPIAAYNTPGSVSISSPTKTNEYGDNAIRYFSDSHTNEDGTLYTEKYFINIDDFEWSESSGAPDFYYQTVERGWILKSSNYLAGVLGLDSADFPIRIISTNTVYGSGIPYLNCQFFTKTGKSGFFDWRVNGKAENAVLNATGGDSDIFVVRFTQNDNTWSADKTYAEIKQAIDDGKVVQGVVYNNFIGIGILNGEIVIFHFNASSFDPDSGIYGLKVLVIIVKADGITVHDSWDEPWGEYHDAILPSQVLLVTNAGGNISAKLSALGERGSPLTYLISYNALNTFPVLTALYLVPNVAPERFYFSNVVTTPDSATSSTKVDFVFKSADATKTLTGSVTTPNDWDDETPFVETWTYIEADPLDGAVRYDKTQSLTDAQKQQARDNIGVVDVPTPSAENIGKVPVATALNEDASTYGYEMRDLADPRVTIFHVTGRNPMAMDITLDELNAAIAAGNIVFAVRATGQDANPELVYRYQETRTYTYSADSTSTKHVFVCATKPETESIALQNTPRLEYLYVNVSTGFVQSNFAYTAKVLSVIVNNSNGQLKTTTPVRNLSSVATSSFFNAFPLIFIQGNNTTPYEIYQVASSQNSGTSPNIVTTVKCTRYANGKLYELTFTGPLSSNDANETVVTKTETALLPAPTTGTAGQLIKVKAADTDGNITETEAVDDALPAPSAENVGKIPVSKQVGDGYKYVMEDKSTSDLSLGITGASTGQSPIINAVDADGKPTAWGAAVLAKADGSNIPTANMDAWRTGIAALPGVKVYGKADANGKIKAYTDAACTEEAGYTVPMALADYGNALLIYDHKTYQCVGFEEIASSPGLYSIPVFFRSEIATDSAGAAVLKVETAKLNVLDYQSGAINAPITITAGELPLTTTTTT